MPAIKIIDITPDNARQHSFFCIKDTKSEGFEKKHQWFTKQYALGLRFKLLVTDGKPAGFIEYVPAESAWRPLNAPNYMFIHCMMVYPNINKNHGLGTLLLSSCENDARQLGMHGVCVMTSKGSWVADMDIFLKLGFTQVDTRGRFELLSKTWKEGVQQPQLIDWIAHHTDYEGWHLVYAHQCPWHEKAIHALQKVANEYDFVLHVHELKTAIEAKEAPSGFGVFSLMKDGKLLEDHYISETRFRNILKKELEATAS